MRRSILGRTVAAFAIVMVLAACSMPGAGRSPTPSTEPTDAADASASSPPNLSADPTAIVAMTVSEVLAGLADDSISGSVTVTGYWTDRSVMHSCAAPDTQPGELEIYCHDGEYGITELDEPIGTLTRGGNWIPATGPSITPYIEEALLGPLVTLPGGNGQPHPPVPINVDAHFDDPRADQCRPPAVELCRDRMVIDRIVAFDPAAVPTPGITAPPSPFPVDDPPPARFEPEDCAGDVDYSFVGWTTLADLGLDLGNPDDHVYAMVTSEVIQTGERIDDPAGSGARFRTMGRRICFTPEWESEGVMQFAHVPGSAYRDWDDGRQTPIEP